MPDLVAILDVVVDEREVVQQFERRRRAKRIFGAAAFTFRDGDEDARTQPLPAFRLRVVEGEVFANQRAVGRTVIQPLERAFEIRFERFERRGRVHGERIRYFASTPRSERTMLTGRIASAAAVASNPEWTMQSSHFGLPLP